MWDLFCRVVDNYGDIGVSWRLARMLDAEHGVALRLWVDDLAAFARIEPRVRPDADLQRIGSIDIRHWCEPFPDVQPGAAVIEAFGCPLPERFLAAMAARRPAPVWVNLEYLTAEPFAAECHGLPSPHPRLPLTRHFFFPGFDARTGGVLRERDLLAARDAAQRVRSPGPLRVSVFGYDNPAFAPLLRAWAEGGTPVECLVPEGRAAAGVAAFLGRPLAAGETAGAGPLTVRVLPFTDQPGYDRLLWSCDWNFVRGEDSFVRAQWAARPFVWQIYPQAEDAHRAKLDAFLARYTDGLAPAAAGALTTFSRAFDAENPVATAQGWEPLRAALPSLAGHALRWAEACARQSDLATRLVDFARSRL
jgi:uncharacterized repeat protein (TIGR03837 family)